MTSVEFVLDTKSITHTIYTQGQELAQSGPTNGEYEMDLENNEYKLILNSLALKLSISVLVVVAQAIFINWSVNPEGLFQLIIINHSYHIALNVKYANIIL